MTDEEKLKDLHRRIEVLEIEKCQEKYIEKVREQARQLEKKIHEN